SAVKMLVNVLSVDIDRQLAFYQGLFGFAEIERSRSPIYRALDTGESELGFNAPAARDLLSLPPAGPAPGVDVFATFVLDGPGAVDAAAARAVELGGLQLKPPFRTYYGQWQAVLADPEGHVFRVASLTLPAGA
ncbi:MAG: VOC family protein, partial [Steroidobacteraceae bacterium]|nr:VOC family protein [Steroidobacteraceae bacterium]